MIEFYTWQTSNGQRVAILLEECGFAYRVHKIDLTKGEQKSPGYLKINPAGAIPAIVDSDGPGGTPLTLTQSGAIDLYLAEKAGKFIPADPVRRALAHQWLLFALSDCAPASTAIFFQSAGSQRPHPTLHLPPMRQAKPRPIISCAPGGEPTACPC